LLADLFAKTKFRIAVYPADFRDNLSIKMYKLFLVSCFRADIVRITFIFNRTKVVERKIDIDRVIISSLSALTPS